MLWLVVHIPKTAGTSFRKSMRTIFGQSMILDYADKPLKVNRWKRNWRTWLEGRKSNLLQFPDNSCIFGHYMPLKFSELLRTRDCRLITWLRDPIARMVSNYHFIFEHHQSNNLPHGVSDVVDENWSLERFMFSPRYRNYASQFLWGVPLKRFDFVGIVEHYQEDLEYLGEHFFSRSLAMHHVNKTSAASNSPYLDDSPLRRKAERFHAQDMRLYRRALEMRMRRQPAALESRSSQAA